MVEFTSYEPGTPSWLDLATTDLAAAKVFYTGLFGWTDTDMPSPEGAYAIFSWLSHSDIKEDNTLDMWVEDPADPSVRGQGVGRALIEAVYAAADAAGCPSVYWMTQEFNAEARKLYDRIATLTPFIKYQR